MNERSPVEEELERRRQDLEDFFENGTVALHWVASDGSILRVNQAELDLLGYTREENFLSPLVRKRTFRRRNLSSQITLG